jgi:hypothetical protein
MNREQGQKDISNHVPFGIKKLEKELLKMDLHFKPAPSCGVKIRIPFKVIETEKVVKS